MILFLMAGPGIRALPKQLETPPGGGIHRGTFNANHEQKTAFQTLAAPQSAPSMTSQAGVVKPRGHCFSSMGQDQAGNGAAFRI